MPTNLEKGLLVDPEKHYSFRIFFTNFSLLKKGISIADVLDVVMMITGSNNLLGSRTDILPYEMMTKKVGYTGETLYIYNVHITNPYFFEF